jgi:hypothetical protein
MQHVHWGHLLNLGGTAVCFKAQQPKALLHAALWQAHFVWAELLRQLSVDLGARKVTLHDKE